MAGAVEYLKPIGFWSYAREDDKSLRGKLGQLRDLLTSELRSQLGEEVELFHDVGAIPYGAEWEREIRHAIGKANFFVPIITPRFLRSHWCNKEVELFVARQNEIFAAYPAFSEHSRIFPILYIDVDDVDPQSFENLEQITRRQYLKFSHLRLKNYESEEVLTQISRLAGDIRKLLRLKVPRAPTPEERAAQDRRRADEEAERARLAAEAQRRDEEAAAIAAAERARRAEQADLERQRLKAQADAAREARRLWWRKYGPVSSVAGGLVLVVAAMAAFSSPGGGGQVSPSDSASADASELASAAPAVDAAQPSLSADAARLTTGCDGGNAADCSALGYNYQMGNMGLAKDGLKAVYLYRKACDKGDATGCFDLGTEYDPTLPQFGVLAKDAVTATALYRQGCTGGQASSCTNLGTFYDPTLDQVAGITKDGATAAAFYKQGCDGDNAIGCRDLGSFYYKGIGVTADAVEARKLFQKACDMKEKGGCDWLTYLDKQPAK